MKFFSWINGTLHVKPNGLCAIVSTCRVGTVGVMIRVKELFKGHNILISGFNIFVPKGYEMALDNDEALPQEKTVKCQEAISFVNMIKVKTLFHSVEFQLQMLFLCSLMMTFVPTDTLSK